MVRLRHVMRLGGLLICLVAALAVWPGAASPRPAGISGGLLEATPTVVPPTRNPPPRPTRVPPTTVPPTIAPPTVAPPTLPATVAPPTIAPPTPVLDEMVLPVVADTYTDVFTPEMAHGHEGRLKVKADEGGWTMSTYLAFDLAALPDGAQVFTAMLHLAPVAGGERPLRMTVGAASCPWNETLTWRESANRGCARVEPRVDAVVTDRAPLSIDVTAIVRAQRDGEAPDHGFVIDTPDAGNTTNVTVSFASSEWVESDALPAHLVMHYSTPSDE